MKVVGYAFLDENNIVVQNVRGDLSPKALEQFASDYGVIFGAVAHVPVVETDTVWIGGGYNPENGQFVPPIQPEREQPNGD